MGPSDASTSKEVAMSQDGQQIDRRIVSLNWIYFCMLVG